MRPRKFRTPSYDQTYDNLVTEISQFEKTFADSTSSLLQRKRKQVADCGRILVQQVKKSVARSQTLRKETDNRARKEERYSENETRPITLRHRLPAIPASRIGPGSYNTRVQRMCPAVLFERAPRFHMTYEERLETYVPHARELTPEEKRDLALRIRNNISAIKRYTPDERLKTLHIKAQLEESRSSLTRLLRTEIIENTRRKREEDLDNKLRRFEWRMNAAEISKGKAKWTVLLCVLSQLSFWQRKFVHRKVSAIQALHERAEKVLRFLLQISIAVGRVRRLLCVRRKARALVVLRRLGPFVTRWAKTHRKTLAEKITDMIETSISQDTIYRLVASWKRRVLFT